MTVVEHLHETAVARDKVKMVKWIEYFQRCEVQSSCIVYTKEAKDAKELQTT